MNDVTIVIPCLDDARSLEVVLPQIRKVICHFRIPAEIAVIDGGSKDDTVDVATRLGVKVWKQREPGYGAAIKTALENVETKYFITLDPDGSHPPNLLPYLYRLREDAAIVVASRYIKQGFSRMPYVRAVGSRALNIAYRNLLDLPVHDLSSGYRLYDRRAITDLKLEMSSYAVLQEILIKAYCQGHTVKEVPMHYIMPSGAQSRRRVRQLAADYLRTFRVMWRLRNSVESCDYDTRAFFSNIPLQRWWQRRRYSIILGHIGSALRVLDAGCGSTQMLNGAPQVVGMDPLMRKLRFMRGAGRRLVNGSTFDLPFKTSAFDVVISSQVIEHLPEDDRIFSELLRCLTPGGTLILGTVDYGRWQWPLIERMYALAKPTGYADEHITHYTRQSLLDRLANMGLAVEDVQYILGGEIIIKARKPGSRLSESVS